ncbi:fascin-2-like isoform X1 [Conger conger]|uniref:fascin-2-like isoform X1 n=1 Tax=Conger conger TaxID=82655 RepID=UPI002A5A449A|nr:fascin-2-like isoform X1 [Conger conger]
MPTNGQNSALKLRFGLINHESRYLTAEAFGFKLNASAPSLKRKQVWTLEQDEHEAQVVYLRSHLGRYLSSDQDGRVSCEGAEPAAGARFVIVPQSDGRWALQSQPYLRFFGGSRDQLSCFAQAIGEPELWAMHLALHPQANLLSLSRRRYAHLSPEEGEVSLDGNVPWGVRSLLTLVYLGGRYSLKTCDSRFLNHDGRLLQEPGRGTGFTLELRAGRLAFKDCEGKYLTPTGPSGTLRAGRCSKPGKDELFDLEESHPQVVLQTPNGKYVSIRQGVNISANQDDETDMETFQMEIDRQSRKCTFRSKEGQYWTLVSHGGIQSTATEVVENTMFELQWLGRRVAMKASNGKYVCTKKNGQLAAVSDSTPSPPLSPGEDEQLMLKLINRPMLILRGENGFVCHHRGSNTLDASRSVYDIFSLHFSDGAYHIKGVDGKFWYVAGSGLVCSDGEVPEDFFLELRDRGRMGIRTQSGQYLRGDQGGTLKADGQAARASALWEY